jgi:hypothetical protein
MDIALRTVDLLYTGADFVFQTEPDITAWNKQKMDASLVSTRENVDKKCIPGLSK